MIMVRNLTAEGAEFHAEVTEKNFSAKQRSNLLFFVQDSLVETSRRDEMFIDKAAPPKFESSGGAKYI